MDTDKYEIWEITLRMKVMKDSNNTRPAKWDYNALLDMVGNESVYVQSEVLIDDDFRDEFSDGDF